MPPLCGDVLNIDVNVFILMLFDRSIFIKYSSIKLIFLFHSITQDYGEEDTYYFVGGLLQFT